MEEQDAEVAVKAKKFKAEMKGQSLCLCLAQGGFTFTATTLPGFSPWVPHKTQPNSKTHKHPLWTDTILQSIDFRFLLVDTFKIKTRILLAEFLARQAGV